MRKCWRVHCRDSQASPRKNSSATPRRSLTVESQRISTYPRGGPLQVRPRTSRPSSASPSRVSFFVAKPFQNRALSGSREGTPRWSRDGRALYYRRPTTGSWSWSAPPPASPSAPPHRACGRRRRFARRQWRSHRWTWRPRGQRFAVLPSEVAAEGKGSVHATFLLNFFDELHRRLR